MTRAVSRVAPLPHPFALASDAAASSPLHRRLIFVALPHTETAQRLATALAEADGGALVPWQMGLFAGPLLRSWSAYQVDSDVGLAQLVSATELLGAMRGLTDALYTAVANGARHLVDWSPAHADVGAVTAIRSVYPDALVVTAPEIAAQLPAHVRAGLVVGDEPDAVLARLRADAAPISAPESAGESSFPDRLIVIVGCGRSGTTWLEELLMAHPAIAGAPRSESWLFQQLAPLWSAYDEALAAHVDYDHFRRSIRRFCDAILAAGRDRHRPGADFFVEKTPVHSYRLPLINKIYPDAWVVHLLRDGRDVARSVSEVPFFQLPDPADAARMWARVVTTVRRDSAGLCRFRTIRYEDLHADPGGVVADLVGWVGLDVPAEMQERSATVARERVSTHAGTASRLGPGTWQALPGADLARIYRGAGNVLVQEGYSSRTELWRRRLSLRGLAAPRYGWGRCPTGSAHAR